MPKNKDPRGQDKRRAKKAEKARCGACFFYRSGAIGGQKVTGSFCYKITTGPDDCRADDFAGDCRDYSPRAD